MSNDINKTLKRIEHTLSSMYNQISYIYGFYLEKERKREEQKRVGFLFDETINRIFKFYKERLNAGSRLSPAGKSVVRNCLASFKEEDLIRVIELKSQDGWFKRNNARRGFTWFFSSKARIQRYLEEEPKVKVPGMTKV